ncbi:osmoprotectant transporter permease [Cytophagaceae bacterium YF14B1]|uniref:Osmoprotectant transporter permease n=1 Tax=Xanthocytophaga flava TaxID=3048013 RepID=A0AAE3QRQ2_9BACT|nr:osmoprotectant transporter permease [Xanthocytophaga flavus]MDJ1483711.1 osmoprotectant transporter permease [Xanthocytophaga flavus]
MNTYLWLLWSFDALIALVVLYFFFVGLADGSVSLDNMLMWLLILLGIGGILLIGLWLRSATILWILAAPGLVYLLFLLIVVIGKPRWN